MIEAMEILKEKGYRTQGDVAQALCDGGYYKGKSESIRAYLNQIANGRRPMSEKLKRALCALAEGDERMTKALTDSARMTEVGTKLYGVFNEYFRQMDKQFRKSTNEQRILILAELEKLCEKVNSQSSD